MPAKSTNTVDPIVQRLRALIKESPDLKDAAQLYEAILPLLSDLDLGDRHEKTRSRACGTDLHRLP